MKEGEPEPTSTPTQAGSDPAPDFPWFKDPGPFIQHDDNSLEARLENMQGLITPNHLFFVRNNSSSLSLNASEWRLYLEGDAVTEPLELSYNDIRSLPSRMLTSYLECAGNHRAMFDLLKGQKASGEQWMTGGIGNGAWVGVALSDVLTLAGIHASAVSVLLVGLDVESPEEGFRYVLPVEKAMHPDTLLAYELNGETLPSDHGFPLRALVPGWVGSASIKWLGRIVVSSEQLWTRNNTNSYVLIGDQYPPEGESRGKPVTIQVIKSALALPWPAELSAGRHRIHGYAHSPAGSVSRVEWSADSGSTWADANLSGQHLDYSWARFEFVWDAEPGQRMIMTRATDIAGNTQPDQVPFNEQGYLFNQPLPHPIRVT
ncbi:MAG: molybdopterin-dependent oxidoreductase [Truepera sp.]|nr:molybdopterin-dependent oxidoreductase [Truepera sp.]